MCHGVNISGTPVEDSYIGMPSALIKNEMCLSEAQGDALNIFT